MNPIGKIAIAVIAVALVIVIGLIALTANSAFTDITSEELPTAEPTIEASETPEPTQTPDQATSQEEALEDEAQSDDEMYEGALAGLSEEEIGKLAMAEEQNGGSETGEEIADEEGEADESVAGVAD